MYRTMIMNTITSRKDRATITAIIGVLSEIERTKHVITIVCKRGFKLAAQDMDRVTEKERKTLPTATSSLNYTFVFYLSSCT